MAAMLTAIVLSERAIITAVVLWDCNIDGKHFRQKMVKEQEDKVTREV
jgi:hypothetical protein